MPEPTLTALEFPELLRVIQTYAVSDLGRDFLSALKPRADLPRIQAPFRQLQELRELQYREGPLPLTNFPLLTTWLNRATVRGSLLPPEAFTHVLQALRLSRQLKHYLKLGGDLAPSLAALADRLRDLTALADPIAQCISPHNFILDQASPGLAQVRRELTDTRESVNRQIKQSFFTPEYQDVLQNPIISQRHGRYVIPIKADHKGAIPGIIHDQSQTKATLYLEPLAVVEHNNALNLLHNREKREEEAVLRRLTDLLRAYLEDVHLTLAVLAELDAIQAKARFAEEFRAREPIWRTKGGVDFRQARHPLLVQQSRGQPVARDVVPIDLELTPGRRFLIISGANAGGKTVALKTLGLLTLMVQSGIPIPVAEGSEFCPFAAIFADIGDPQDLSQHLSTFSAHLKRALTMLTGLPESALILLDELGTATDPTEGGALALAMLQAFYQRGAYGSATTHLPILKSFAQKTEGFENVAVVFNEETRRPTYRLAYGVVGASNALKLAREMGLSPEILAMAEGYLNQDELRAYRLLAQVEAAQQHLAHREHELAQRDAELDRKNQELEQRLAEVAAERDRLVNEAKQQALARIKSAEAEFKRILKRLNTGEEPWGRLRQEFSGRQAKLLDDLTPRAVPAPAPSPRFLPGQQVFLPALGLTGKILAVDDRDGRLEVQARNVKLRVSPEEVTLVGGEAGKAIRSGTASGYHRPPAWLPSLNLVGLRVDEALPLVDRLIDQAVLHGSEKVDIIHGVGTGRLKQAVWQHLKRHTLVKALHPDDNPGVTVVELHD
ncbi:MAG: Smr/MutS family protein [Syntrophobacterales bacterium]|jgi:DNA mismatch repair protein MutS2|nr:Smr/MutS family protein [Syntrophobacterales bacterium]